MLSEARVVQVGESPHDHEREAIEFARKNIPDRDPLRMWALVEFLDPSTGRMHEVDLLVLGYSALYLIEIKSGPGTYVGDSVEWYRTPPGQTRSFYMDAPYKLANYKAKVLRSRLQSKMRRPEDAPRVEALVFLSAPDTTLKLTAGGEHGVILRNQLTRAVTHHDFPGAPQDWRGRPISTPAAQDVAQALKALGIRSRKGRMHVGSYELGELLHEGPGYQDRAAVHRNDARIHARARTYLVPTQTAIERRQQLMRAAEREASLLYDVREHPHVLSWIDYVPDAPLGPTVLLEAFDDSQPLGAFLRQHPDLPFEERVELVLQVGRALAHCHRKNVRHGALSPDAVLVRRTEPATAGRPGIDTRLFSFQLGSGESIDSTSHRTDLTPLPNYVYQAPELRRGHPISTCTDIFGLGAVAHLVFTGRSPGETLQEVDARLTRDGCLDPSVVTDSVPKDVAEWIRCLTAARPVDRETEITSWLQILEQEARKLTEPPPEAAVDPLQAVPGDSMEGGFLVEQLLGYGATSRVLQVLSDRHDGSYALKVSASDEHDERLRREGEQLGRLRHPHIVPWIETLTVSGRTCLLLGLAGETTLDKHLASEGTVSLEYASRYGEDLLGALEELEVEGVLHRDIKPANVGVRARGRSKTAHHLNLFDFSLAGASLTDVRVGTTAYREPYLAQRGAWDHAADRWSAAITLHEMLTAVRPTLPPDANPADPTAAVALAPERFDPAVRESLTAFFTRALHPDVEQRFPSANAMRLAWLRAFDAPAVVASGQAERVVRFDGADTQPPTDSATSTAARSDPVAAPTVTASTSDIDTDPDADPADALDDAALARIAPHTLIGELPLTPRASNALGRAGLTRADELLSLPDNRLSLIRGVGRKVARELLKFRRRWQAAVHLSVAAAEPLFSGYVGDPLPLDRTALDAALIRVLGDAGIHDLSVVAAEPVRRVELLLKQHALSVAPLRALLTEQQRAAETRANPTTLAAWVQLLFGGRKKGFGHVRAWWGLDGPFVGRVDVSARELAEHLELTRAAIHISHRHCRDAWAQLPALSTLRELCLSLLARSGGVLRYDEAAHALLARLPPEPGAATDVPDPRHLAQAVALFRAVADVEQDRATTGETPAFAFARTRRGADARPVGWFLTDAAEVDALARLGEVADEFASRSVVAAPSEVSRALLAALHAHGAFERLAALGASRLIELAALASTVAARSAALEIYQRGMPASRALELSVPVLTGALPPEQVQRRVAGRYPEAEPLPSRPALDALLEPHGLRWNETSARYERPERGRSSSLHTGFATTARTDTTVQQLRLQDQPLPGTRPGPDAAAVAERDFDDALRAALDDQKLLVLSVSANHAADAALALAHRLGVEPALLDQRIATEMRDVLLEDEGDPDGLLQIDAEGPTAADWSDLRQVAVTAAARVAEALVAQVPAPLLLCQPGLLARFQLDGFVRALATASERPETPAILLLVPVTGAPDGLPSIDGWAIPHLNPWQRRRVPSAWIRAHLPAALQAAAS